MIKYYQKAQLIQALFKYCFRQEAAKLENAVDDKINASVLGGVPCLCCEAVKNAND